MPKRKPGRGPFVRIPQYAKKSIQELRKKQRTRAAAEQKRLREEYPSDYEEEAVAVSASAVRASTGTEKTAAAVSARAGVVAKEDATGAAVAHTGYAVGEPIDVGDEGCGAADEGDAIIAKLLQKLNEMGEKRRKRFNTLRKSKTFFANIATAEADRLPAKALLKVGKHRGREGGEKQHFVEHTVGMCFDELTLRNEFPDQGVGHKYFSSGKFEIRYLLSKEGIPICQVVKKDKV
eukprot:g8059.t1